jgi:hypothetical protein
VRTGIWLLDTAATLVRWWVRIIVGGVVTLALMLVGAIMLGFAGGLLSRFGLLSLHSASAITISAHATRWPSMPRHFVSEGDSSPSLPTEGYANTQTERETRHQGQLAAPEVSVELRGNYSGGIGQPVTPHTAATKATSTCSSGRLLNIGKSVECP